MKDELYHQAILDLARAGRGRGRLEASDASVTLDNPLCGDRVTLDLELRGERVADVGHRARGCLLCQAAAAVIGARAPGAHAADLRKIAGEVAQAVAREPERLGDLWPELAAFAPVHPHKSRHECVLLPFEALRDALDQACGQARQGSGDKE